MARQRQNVPDELLSPPRISGPFFRMVQTEREAVPKAASPIIQNPKLSLYVLGIKEETMTAAELVLHSTAIPVSLTFDSC
jgi:hypothetical protein